VLTGPSCSAFIEELGVNVLVTIMLMGLTAHFVAVMFNDGQPYRNLFRRMRGKDPVIGTKNKGGNRKILQYWDQPRGYKNIPAEPLDSLVERHPKLVYDDNGFKEIEHPDPVHWSNRRKA